MKQIFAEETEDICGGRQRICNHEEHHRKLRFGGCRTEGFREDISTLYWSLSCSVGPCCGIDGCRRVQCADRRRLERRGVRIGSWDPCFVHIHWCDVGCGCHLRNASGNNHAIQTRCHTFLGDTFLFFLSGCEAAFARDFSILVSCALQCTQVLWCWSRGPALFQPALHGDTQECRYSIALEPSRQLLG